jgi:RNA polymerase sigma-70 factor (ECF subfamily)
MASASGYRFVLRDTPVDDELELLARARRLDAEALASIHDRYYPLIFRYVAFRTGDRTTAEDLTSEVFTRFLSAIRDRSAPPNSLRGWLFGVAAHIAMDYHRARYRGRQVALDDDLPDEGDDPDALIDLNIQSEQLREAVAGLTEEQQHVIALRFGQSMPIQDVARMMGKSEGAVKQLQARALGTLARRLTSRGDVV